MPILGVIASSAKGAPGIPTIGTATDVGTGRAYNNGAATVSFTPGAGATATSFTATSSPGGFTATGASSPLTVAGLQSSTSYTFTVTATNAAGTSAASSASNSITATTVPQAPTIGSATAGSGSATVTYTAGATGGKTVSTYTATSSPGSFTGTGASPITVSGLTNGTAYTFTVTATNANGTSNASAASNSVTPSLPVYAYSNGGINSSNRMYKSTNSGVSWSATGYLTVAGTAGYGIEGNGRIATNGTGTFVGGGRYSATPNQQWLYGSTNSGTTWTAYNPANTNTGDAFPYSTGPAAYGNGIFIVGGGRATNFPPRSYYSTSGTSWSYVSVYATNNRSFDSLVFNPFDNTFYGSFEGGVFYKSTTGSSWTQITGYTYNCSAVATLGTSSQTAWISSQGGMIFYSGSAWGAHSQPDPSSNTPTTIAGGAGIYVVTYAETNVTSSNLLATSTGSSWTMRANPFTNGSKPNRVYYAGDRFYLSGNGNGLATSNDGLTWTQLSNFAFDSGSIINGLVAGQ